MFCEQMPNPYIIQTKQLMYILVDIKTAVMESQNPLPLSFKCVWILLMHFKVKPKSRP